MDAFAKSDAELMLNIAKQALTMEPEKGAEGVDAFLSSFDLGSLVESAASLAWLKERKIIINGYAAEDHANLEAAIDRALALKRPPGKS